MQARARLARALARFVRLEMWEVVCNFNKLRVASIRWELSASAVVIAIDIGIGSSPMRNATNADK
jgi:hypothetical protein